VPELIKVNKEETNNPNTCNKAQKSKVTLKLNNVDLGNPYANRERIT